MRAIKVPYDFEPRDYQADFMAYFDQGGDRAMWVVHRRGGKDLTAGNVICKQAFKRVGAYWHCFPTYKQARKAYWNAFTAAGKRILDATYPEVLCKRRNEQEMFIELINGSTIQFIGSDNINTLVGSGPVGVVFSEFALNDPRAWDFVRPMLVENKGWAAFITTPRGKNHAFKMYEMARKNPRWFCRKLSVLDTKVLPMEVIDQERAEGMDEALIQQEYFTDFNAANPGSIYGKLMGLMEAKHAFDEFEMQPHELQEVFTTWDLGFGDSTTIWWWRATPSGIDFIDHYEAHGEPMSHYFDILEQREKDRGYRVVKHWLPHDSRNHTLATGQSILNMFIDEFTTARVAVIPRLSVADGLAAGRWLLQQNTRFHPRCEEGVNCLRDYQFEYDEEAKIFKNEPKHDWTSHTADAFRYAAVVVKMSKFFIPKKVERKNKPQATLEEGAFTFDELLKNRKRQQGVAGRKRF